MLCISWNARGVQRKKSELIDLISAINPDVVAIQETFLSADKKFYLPNFTIIRQDRSNTGGGVAIAIHNRIKHIPFNFPILDTIEIVGAKILTENNNFILSSCYLPASKSLSSKDLEIISNIKCPIILAGDFNSKNPAWGCKKLNSNGKILEKFLNTATNVKINAPDYFTHCCSNPAQNDILDFTISFNYSHQIAVKTLPTLSSDHFPISFTLYHKPIFITNSASHYVNWKLFPTLVEPKIDKIPLLNNSTISNIDHQINIINEALTSSRTEASFPNPSSNPLLTNLSLPEHVRKLIKIRNLTRRAYNKYHHQQDKIKVKELNNQIKKEIRKCNNESWTKKLADINLEPNSIWRITKSIYKPPIDPNPILYKNIAITNPQDRANLISDHLKNTMTNDGSPVSEHEDAANDTWHSLTYSPSPPPLSINIADTIKALEKIKIKKAPGPDKITNKMLKILQSSRSFLCIITNLFQSCLTINYFPTIWKNANVITFPKPGKSSNDITNHRPISLLSSFGKTFELIILKFLNHHVTNLHLLRPEQLGFRNRTSTTHQILRLIEFITSAINRKFYVPAVFLDITKAFDRVWHKGLILKLYNLNFPLQLIKIIQNYLTNRTFQVIQCNYASTTHSIQAGVPQGSILSPLLFNLFINDFPSSPQIQTYMYADDTAIATQTYNLNSACHRLSSHLLEIHNWTRNWKISINSNKSKYIIFHRRLLPSTISVPQINNEPIPLENKIKFLGLIIDNKITWNQQTKSALSKANAIKFKLMPLLNHSSPLSTRIKAHTYIACIRPQLVYAAEIWHNTTKTNLKKLEVFQNSCLRLITKQNALTRNLDIHKALKIPSIHNFVNKQSHKFYNKLSLTNNPLLIDIWNYNSKSKFKTRIAKPKTILNRINLCY